MGHRGLEFKKTGYETLVSEFKRVFPICPICGSGLGYDATHKFVTYYVRCNSCGAVWQPEIQMGPVWSSKYELVRLLLVESDKDMRANSLAGKGDRWHKGYKVEFWKSLDLGGLKGEGPTTPLPPPLMYLSCVACGMKLSEGARFCPNCGKEIAFRACHYCGAPIPEESYFCPTCGKEIAAQVCESCGAPIPEGSNFCPSCGKERDR